MDELTYPNFMVEFQGRQFFDYRTSKLLDKWEVWILLEKKQVYLIDLILNRSPLIKWVSKKSQK